MERKDRQSHADVLNFNGKVSHISIRTASKRGFRFESDTSQRVLPVGTSCMDWDLADKASGRSL